MEPSFSIPSPPLLRAVLALVEPHSHTSSLTVSQILKQTNSLLICLFFFACFHSLKLLNLPAYKNISTAMLHQWGCILTSPMQGRGVHEAEVGLGHSCCFLR